MSELFPMLSAEYAADPFPFWKRLREEVPVYWSDDFSFWVITRYDDILDLAMRPQELSSSIGSAGGMEGKNADPARLAETADGSEVPRQRCMTR